MGDLWKVEVRIGQIERGRSYQGTVYLDNHFFDYSLRFRQPLCSIKYSSPEEFFGQADLRFSRPIPDEIQKDILTPILSYLALLFFAHPDSGALPVAFHQDTITFTEKGYLRKTEQLENLVNSLSEISEAHSKPLNNQVKYFKK